MSERETYTIDELAAVTKVPSRTIRFYQARGLLDSPRRIGRKAFYTAAHIARLDVIGKLQDRGLRIRGMKQLLSRGDSDEAVARWLGLSDRLTVPWSDDQPRAMDEAELTALIGDRSPGTLAALVDAGLVARREDAPGTYDVASPGLLDVALRLLDAGLSVRDLAAIEPMLRDNMRRAAEQMIDYIARRSDLGRDEGRLAGALDALREQGCNAVGIIFAHEIEHTLRRLVEQGVTPRRPRNRRRHE